MNKVQWYVRIISIALVVAADMTVCARTKKVKCLLVKGALQVCGDIRACGSIIGANTGDLRAYGSFYNNQTGQTINTGDLMPFTTDSVPPVGMSHGPALFTEIVIQEAGVYLMLFKVRAFFIASPPHVQAQFFINGSPLAGGDDGGLTASFITTMAYLESGDVVTIKNLLDPFVVGTISGATSLACELIRVA